MILCCAYLYPLPAHGIIDEARKDRCEKASRVQRQSVYRHIRSTLMRKVYIGDGNFGQRLTGGCQKSLKHLERPPGACSPDVGNRYSYALHHQLALWLYHYGEEIAHDG